MSRANGDGHGDAHFDLGWLDLREAADHRARAEELLPPLREAWADRGWRDVVDLGSGTGSNLRWLAPRLPAGQRWTLVDHDGELLEEALRRGAPGARGAMDTPGASPPGSAATPGPAVTLTTRRGDLADAGLAAVAEADLVTASALLDLVSERWLRRLVEACRAREAGALLALTYDGTLAWSGPPHPDDALVREAVNEHQHGDKGLGAALGPAAAATARTLFEEAGYRCRLRPSPWVLGAEDHALGRALIGGWVSAATEVRPGEAERLEAWGRARTEALRSETLTVGHQDLLALP